MEEELVRYYVIVIVIGCVIVVLLVIIIFVICYVRWWDCYKVDILNGSVVFNLMLEMDFSYSEIWMNGGYYKIYI